MVVVAERFSFSDTTQNRKIYPTRGTSPDRRPIQNPSGRRDATGNENGEREHGVGKAGALIEGRLRP
jgi:hypothetical protein